MQCKQFEERGKVRFNPLVFLHWSGTLVTSHVPQRALHRAVALELSPGAVAASWWNP